ncbi:MAG: hypothetical protein FJ279_35985, partial [Planctomycetes bacterium]|nr:hypothetical protein [Planctomycetota bacterium]
MRKLASSVVVTGLLCLAAQAEDVEFFILWGLQGQWHGSLEIEGGRFLKVETFSFEEQYGDKWEGADERRASWRSGTGGQMDGVHVKASVTAQTVFHLKTGAASRDLRWSDFLADADAKVPLGGKDQFLVLGRGNPDRGPRLPRSIPLPTIFQPPQPKDPIALPDACGRTDEPVVVRLAQAPPGALLARRLAKGDGRLYLEVCSPAGRLVGRAEVAFGGKPLGTREMDGSLWLSLQPRIGAVQIQVTAQPGVEDAPWRAAVLHVPTTLIETRGPKLYVNGEPFLVKGTLPRDLNDADAAYLKSLCANTVRIGTNSLDYLDKYGFMGIVMTGRWPGQF